MDTSKVKCIIEANLDHLKKKFGLQNWDIDITYGNCDGDPALSMCDVDYKIIEITIDLVHIDDEAEVLHALRHELVHGLIASFHTYRESVKCFLTDKEINSTNVNYRRAEEEVVCAFVRILERKNEN